MDDLQLHSQRINTVQKKMTVSQIWEASKDKFFMANKGVDLSLDI